MSYRGRAHFCLGISKYGKRGNRHKFPNFQSISTKFGAHTGSGSEQHIRNFEQDPTNVRLPLLRKTAKCHLKLSDFFQSWWAVVYPPTQCAHQIWFESVEK